MSLCSQTERDVFGRAGSSVCMRASYNPTKIINALKAKNRRCEEHLPSELDVFNEPLMDSGHILEQNFIENKGFSSDSGDLSEPSENLDQF